ncbi:hypothetical protein SEA_WHATSAPIECOST_50 [Mycobacterium phage Whatsapiecost]|nr:hypothetical protein SEA_WHATSAPIECOST_50 [Mycobacterium phage Whatsapiecost]
MVKEIWLPVPGYEGHYEGRVICNGMLPAPWGKNFGPSDQTGGCRRPWGHKGPCHPVELAEDKQTTEDR